MLSIATTATYCLQILIYTSKTVRSCSATIILLPTQYLRFSLSLEWRSQETSPFSSTSPSLFRERERGESLCACATRLPTRSGRRFVSLLLSCVVMQYEYPASVLTSQSLVLSVSILCLKSNSNTGTLESSDRITVISTQE